MLESVRFYSGAHCIILQSSGALFHSANLVLCSQSSRYTKLEKADILEMTVRHLRSLRHHQRTGKPLLGSEG